MNELTAEQKAYGRAILEHASRRFAAHKRDAVESGDINASIELAVREANMENFFRARGIEIEKP